MNGDKCAHPKCNKISRPKSEYCSELCYQKIYQKAHRAERNGLGNRYITSGVEVCPPDVALPYRLSKLEWGTTKCHYPPGTVYWMDGERKVLGSGD